MLPDENRTISYFKRFRMELPLTDLPPLPELPPGYSWLPWSECLVDAHAEALHVSFRNEIDAVVFPSLGDPVGCRCLMFEIARKAGFLQEATWLITSEAGPVGTVQGVRDRTGLGAIQNLGVAAGHRGRGLGEALLLRALGGFRACGLPAALLEVTARNDPAVRLYRRLGFRCRKTLYKAVEVSTLVGPA
jgi:ribosomal protein S18 acetylase RimI-like enzyme